MVSDGERATESGQAAHPLTCREAVELVTAYLEGALAPSDLGRLDAHLEACDNCSTYYDQIREAVRLVRASRESGLGAATRTRLLELFRRWRESGLG